ncbi:MAG: DNA mismatch repair endonuclease MutL [Treponema sp.]|jgi:DNA mismatch repair protein MutL|nr:DNA mismatch repair endonuclease MutL [Treponema sp.]
MTEPTAGRIQVLPPEEARRIAAGEVVDRPAALIREFIDNAVDAGASQVEVSIEGGGSRRAEVIDDGGGMNREDLSRCWLTHATSKIRSLEDLNTTETLGFRGEALAAAAAVSRLEILSSTDGREAWRLEVGPGERNPPRLEPARRTRGTSVRALGLFDAIPARKRFLKREGSEGSLCRQIFIDKALAFPALSFRFSQDGKLKDFFPAVNSNKERFAAALPDSRDGTFLHEIHCSGEGFSAAVVIGGPELYRNDRRQLFVFANGRRIQDFALLQAMEYGVQGWFPNGTHPVGAVFVKIKPRLADFNIHPAKREVRFADPGAIHHAITSALRDFARRFNLSRGAAAFNTGPESGREAAAYTSEPGLYPDDSFGLGSFAGSAGMARHGPADGGRGGAYGGRADSGGAGPAGHGPADGFAPAGALAMEALLERPPDFAPMPGRAAALPGNGAPFQDGAAAESGPPEYRELRYAGRAFGLFILVEAGDKLYIIDQHAAHERILYDRFLSRPIPQQELLVPIPFSAESDEEDRFLESRREDLGRLGVVINRDGTGWSIEALPVDWRLGDAETVKELLSLREAGENMAERWAATLCCHGAVRDGDYLDNGAALALATEALELPDPHCPHGRPVWTEISRDALYRAVRRI